MTSNSCANFVQNTAAASIIKMVTEPGQGIALRADSEFVDHYDGFVAQEDVPSYEDTIKLYRGSESKMKEFQAILTRFTETLQKRKVFANLNTPMRSPRNFDLEYVLSISNALSEYHDREEEIRTCKRFVRKVCQKATKHKNVLAGLISLAPTDTYGSLITGGFTLILAAIESHETARLNIQGALSDIPKKLSKITRIANIHIKRVELHQRADEVLIAIFAVLERIIDRLSRTWRDSIASKFRDTEGSVKDAIQALEDAITEFNDEAQTCAQLRLGRMEETNFAVKAITESLKVSVDGTSTRMNGMENKLNELCDKQGIMLKELSKSYVGVQNQLYRLMSGNPTFNSADGTLDRNYLAIASADRNNKSSAVSVKESKVLVHKWFRSLRGFNPGSEEHIKKCVNHAGSLEPQEQDKTEYIMVSESFQRWLEASQSSLLHIRAETSPTETVNFMALATAMLALTLGGCTSFAVLSFFCGIRKNASLAEEDSGTLAILKSLNGQLLRFLWEKHRESLLAVTENMKMWKKSNTEVKWAWLLFKKLVLSLPERSVVFILLDSVSRVSGDKTKVDSLVERIMDIMGADREQDVTIIAKVFVTDSFPGSRLVTLAKEWHSLYVPDDVDGWGSGINHRWIEQKNVSTLQRLQHRDEDTSEADSSDGDWNLDSDDGAW